MLLGYVLNVIVCYKLDHHYDCASERKPIMFNHVGHIGRGDAPAQVEGPDKRFNWTVTG